MPSKFHTLTEEQYTDDSIPDVHVPVKRPKGRPPGSKNKRVGKNVSFTADKKRRFINKLRKNGGNKAAAAAYVGVSKSTICAHEKKDPVFAEKVNEAKNYALHEVAEEMHRRGVEGWTEPVFYQGEQIGEVRRFSDALLIKRIEALAPETYGKKSQIDINQNVTIETQARSKLANLLGIDIEGEFKVLEQED